MHVYDSILLKSSFTVKFFRQICRENQNTYFMSNKLFFF